MSKTTSKNWKKAKAGRKNHVGNRGYVYILTNPSYKSMVKIGLTKRNVPERLKELNRATGVPTEFVLEHFVETSDCKKLESTVHNVLKKNRVNNRREFFYVSPSKAKKIVNKHRKIIDGEKDSNLLGVFILLAIVGFGAYAGMEYFNIQVGEIKNLIMDKISPYIL